MRGVVYGYDVPRNAVSYRYGHASVLCSAFSTVDLFPRVEGLDDSFEFCRRLLEETKVGIAPGVAFGAGGEGSIRICYAASREILEPAMERLARFLTSASADRA